VHINVAQLTRVACVVQLPSFTNNNCSGCLGVVCVLRVDGTWHADGARVGDAQQTRRGHARSSTHTNQASGPSTHGSVKAPASPCSGSGTPSGCAAGDATRAEGPHAVAELEGEPLGQRTRDALAVEAAERARAPATGRAGLP
jgi:hypothetical protein